VFFAGVFSFTQTTFGLITRPYETYRRIADRGRVIELPALAALLLLYFSLASIVKTAAFRPYLLTRQFVVLCSGAGFLYLLTAMALWKAARALGGTGSFGKFARCWSYTLIPTVCWFFATSLLFVLLPPPRTTSAQGIAFSLLYLVFSATLFFWKVILSYLSLRFAMRLTLVRICLSVLFVSPLIVGASIFLYSLGIFKIPFI